MLPLGFIFLFIMNLVNGVQRFKQNKFFSFMPFLLILATLYLESGLDYLLIRIDFDWHLENRTRAVEYIEGCVDFGKNHMNQKYKVPDEIGYVSKPSNYVWVDIGSGKELKVKFPVKAEFMGGAMPDLLFVYTSNKSGENSIGGQTIKLKENWYLEVVDN